MYVDHPNETARYRWVKAPTSQELAQLTHTIAHRIGGFLEHQRLLVRDAENSCPAVDAVDGELLDQVPGHSIMYRIAVGPQAGLTHGDRMMKWRAAHIDWPGKERLFFLYTGYGMIDLQ